MHKKKYIFAFLIALWLVLLVIGFIREPSSRQSGKSYAIMKSDIRYVLANGGNVVDTVDVVKPGRARVARTIDVEGWSDALLRKYHISLNERGWRQISVTDFCKQGIYAKVIPNAGMRSGREINLISMEFDTFSMDKCAAR